MSSEIVLATGNHGKVSELQAVLNEFGIQIRAQSEFEVPEAEETGLTFVENALIKARNACQHTGLPAIADDSGLCVDALGGAPGIYSSRFAGPAASDSDNIDKLLADLSTVAEAERGAHFHCSLVYLQYAEDPDPVICTARWQGEIIHQRRGDNGFGYDPIFQIMGDTCTSAELPAEQKNRISHRGKALKMLLSQLRTK